MNLLYLAAKSFGGGFPKTAPKQQATSQAKPAEQKAMQKREQDLQKKLSFLRIEKKLQF